MKKNPHAAHIARLEAIMDVLGYGDYGGQGRFAKEIGIAPKNFNHAIQGYPLSTTVAFRIKERFKITTDFLWFGDPAGLAVACERDLRAWQRRTGRRIFSD